MGIGNINDYSSILSNYKVPVIPQVSIDEVQKQDKDLRIGQKEKLAEAGYQADNHDITGKTEPKAVRNDVPLEDISLTFNTREDFDYLGQNSDIHSLDVQEAVSDMKKDGVLKQYQYFVGNSQNMNNQLADGIVIPKF